jgi:hypothetical protein
MKKKLILVSFLLIICNLAAQTPLFPSTEGVVLLYHQKDENGEIKSQQRTTITKVNGNPEKLTVFYKVENLDANGLAKDPPAVVNTSLVAENGVINVDVSKMISTLNGMEKAKVTVSGNGYKLTPEMKVGQAAEDMVINIAVGIFKIKATICNTKCTAIEKVKVAAGSFTAFKVEQTIIASMIGIKQESRTVTWYVQGIGTVKALTYDKKGKLLAVNELVKIY